MCYWHHCNESINLINPVVGLQICPVLRLRQLEILLRFLLPSLLQAGLRLIMCTSERPHQFYLLEISVSNALWFALNFCWQKSSPFYLSDTLSYYTRWNLRVTFKHIDRKKDLVGDCDNYKQMCLPHSELHSDPFSAENWNLLFLFDIVLGGLPIIFLLVLLFVFLYLFKLYISL